MFVETLSQAFITPMPTKQEMPQRFSPKNPRLLGTLNIIIKIFGIRMTTRGSTCQTKKEMLMTARRNLSTRRFSSRGPEKKSTSADGRWEINKMGARREDEKPWFRSKKPDKDQREYSIEELVHSFQALRLADTEDPDHYEDDLC